MSVDITVTIPKGMPRDRVIRQLRGCNGRPLRWCFAVNLKPKLQVDRMHFVHQDELIGSLPIAEISELGKPRTLRRPDGTPLTTNRRFAIEAGGRFVPPDRPTPFKAHRGWRYFDHSCRACNGLGCTTVTDDDAEPCPTCNGSGSI